MAPSQMSTGLIAAVLACLVVGTVAFALFYTPEGRWAQGTMGGSLLPAAPLTVALPSCLKTRDPSGFAAFSRNGAYRMSGWFLPMRRRADVVQCMAEKGWLYTPLNLYSP